MNRKQQYKNYIQRFRAQTNNDFFKGFREGQKWADKNPDWRIYPDEKPPEEINEYVTCDSQGNIEINNWTKCSNTPFRWYGKIDLYPKFPIVAWMPKPNPPKNVNKDDNPN